MSITRKITKYQLCERHAPWFAGETRYRKLECMVEGGPGGWSPGCADGECRLWPGTDVFDPSVCHSEMELDWTTPRVRFEILGETIDAPVDATPYPIHGFERGRPYVVEHEGAEYVLIHHTDGRGHVAHPTRVDEVRALASLRAAETVLRERGNDQLADEVYAAGCAIGAGA